LIEGMESESAGDDGAAVSRPTECTAPLPKQPRPKMALDEQADFLAAILRRCKMHGRAMRDHFAGEATLTLTTDDMLRLEAIQQTMMIFHQHDAGRLVKQEIGRKMRGRSAR
jgi:hypothetical protein